MASTLPQTRFGFRSTNVQLKGGAGAGILIAAGLWWAAATNRLHDSSVGYWSGWGIGAAVVGIAVCRGHWNAVRYARGLGYVAMDARGLRWVRPDETVISEFEWSRVLQAVVDLRTSTIVVVLRPALPDEQPTAVVLGDTAGSVAFEDFAGLVRAMGTFVSLSDLAKTTHSHGRGLARSMGAWSVVFAFAGVAMLWANRTIESAVGARHMFPLVPCGFGFLAFVYALAAFAFLRGRGPMVSVLYNPLFLRKRVPLMGALLVFLNFVIVAAMTLLR